MTSYDELDKRGETGAFPFIREDLGLVKRRQEAKDQTERLIFSDFSHKVPDFAGSPILTWDRGPKDESGNPCPDFICTTDQGEKIGIELTEWLHEGQMRMSQEKLREEERFLSILDTEREAKPESIGFVSLWFKDGARLPRPVQKKNGFRHEFYDLLKNEDGKIREGKEFFDPGGFYPVNDLSPYTILYEFLHSVVMWNRSFQSPRGPRWVGSNETGGAFTPNDSFEALKENIRKKLRKSTYQDLIRQRTVSEIILLVHYDQGRWNNTPYKGIMEVEGGQKRVSFTDIAKMAAGQISGDPGPFSKIFLFNHIEFQHENPQDHIFQIHPSFKPCIPR